MPTFGAPRISNMSEPFKLYVREKFVNNGVIGLPQSYAPLAATSQIVGFENRSTADFAFTQLENSGVFVVKLYS